MKMKIMISSILAAACFFVFSGATWADSRKDRHKNPPVKKKYVAVAKHHTPIAYTHQRHWKKAQGHHHKIHRYQKHHRAGYHRYKDRPRDYRYRPYYRYHHKPRHKYIPRHKIHRPIYSHKDGNVSITAKTSHRGWSIKISARD